MAMLDIFNASSRNGEYILSLSFKCEIISFDFYWSALYYRLFFALAQEWRCFRPQIPYEMHINVWCQDLTWKLNMQMWTLGILQKYKWDFPLALSFYELWFNSLTTLQTFELTKQAWNWHTASKYCRTSNILLNLLWWKYFSFMMKIFFMEKEDIYLLVNFSNSNRKCKNILLFIHKWDGST